MTVQNASSAEEYRMVTSFESLRSTLKSPEYEDRMNKPLAYWALPNDRRLPLAFLGRTIGDLLNTPFAELTATPGIGQKKISSLMKLLARATRDEPPAIPFADELTAEPTRKRADDDQGDPSSASASFDPALVSEALWEQWKQTVRHAGLGQEKFGRLAPILQHLPTVIWETPLSSYLDCTLDEVRNMKTHGEKRVRVILEVFGVVDRMLSSIPHEERLAVRLTPKFVPPIERWACSVIEQQLRPTRDELRDHLVIPLLDQIRIDAGDVVAQLTRERLGIDAPPKSVRIQSREMGVTRARIYQLIDDCSVIMRVRWPEGRMLFKSLAAEIDHPDTPAEAVGLFSDAYELFYPKKLEKPESNERSD